MQGSISACSNCQRQEGSDGVEFGVLNCGHKLCYYCMQDPQSICKICQYHQNQYTAASPATNRPRMSDLVASVWRHTQQSLLGGAPNARMASPMQPNAPVNSNYSNHRMPAPSMNNHYSGGATKEDFNNVSPLPHEESIQPLPTAEFSNLTLQQPSSSEVLNTMTFSNSSEERPSGPDYLCRPLDYRSIVTADCMMDYKSNRCAKFVAPGFLDSTRDDQILISEFSGNRVLLCTRALQMIQEYNFFRTSKNVFVIKENNTFLCSDWHRISLVDMAQTKMVWSARLMRPWNPWGLCVLEETNQVAVCLPSTEQIVLFDVRSSSEVPVGEWSFKGATWSDRLLPYAIAPNGMVTVGTNSGYGALMRVDLKTGKPLEVLTRLDLPAMSCDKEEEIAASTRAPFTAESVINSAITDIALDCEKTCIIPDALNSRIIFRSNNGDVNLLSENSMIRHPSGVTLLRDGTLIISDNRTNTILTCNL